MSDIHVLVTLPFAEHFIERWRTISPQLKIRVRPAREASELPADLVSDAEVLYTARALPEPDEAPNLKWLQLHFAGLDHVADHPLLQSEIIITTLSGAAASQMAEYAIMAMLALGHRLPQIEADRKSRNWFEDRFDRYSPMELRGSTVGLIGYGSIAREIARMAHALGAQILAAKRDLKNLDDGGYSPEGLGDPAAELPLRIYPSQALRSMVGECDFVVVTVPLTPDTSGMVNKLVIDAMRPGAVLIDISRGGVVDHGALVAALQEKRLGGAALDVYPIEPLPESSPLWDMPGVILTPHIAGGSPKYYERAAALFGENLRRYLTDQPLLNLYSGSRGY
jgi:phosphoglycerate dehydrogenase-like enzyme